MESMSVKIDEQTWKQISARLTNAEALNVLHEVVDYATQRLRSRIDGVKSSRDAIAFLSEGRVLDNQHEMY